MGDASKTYSVFIYDNDTLNVLIQYYSKIVCSSGLSNMQGGCHTNR